MLYDGERGLSLEGCGPGLRVLEGSGVSRIDCDANPIAKELGCIVRN